MIELDKSRVYFRQVLLLPSVHIVVVHVEDESYAVVQYGAPGSQLQLTLEYPHHPVPARPAVHEETFYGTALAEGIDVSGKDAVRTEELVQGVDLMTSVAAVLLPLTGHPVHDGLLGAIVERVDGSVHHALQSVVLDLYYRHYGPRISPSSHAYPGKHYRPVEVADEELDPSVAFEVEGLEAILPFFADKSCPGMEVGIDYGRFPGLVSFVDQHLHDCSFRGIDAEEREPYTLFVEGEYVGYSLSTGRLYYENAVCRAAIVCYMTVD